MDGLLLPPPASYAICRTFAAIAEGLASGRSSRRAEDILSATKARLRNG